MAVLIDVNNIKEEKVSRKLELNKFSIIITFIIFIFIVKLLFEVIDSFFDIYKILDEYYDFTIILISLVLTYIYSKNKYLKNQHFKNGFIDLSKKKNKSIKVEPSVLKRLDNKNYILNNVKISLKSGINYIDTLCINDKGIFIIYSRNDKGIIRGNDFDNKWELENEFGFKKINNPIFILEKQINKLNEYIKEIGYNINVKGIIYYFEETKLNIKLNNEDIKIFNKNTDEELIKYIEKLNSKYKISFSDILRIVSKIK